MKTFTVASSARLIWLAILLSLGILFSAKPTTAFPDDMLVPVRNVLSSAQQQDGPTDPAELEAFLEELMAEQMEEHHIPGAAVAVVKDGELFFTKGYGLADIEAGIPVDPDRTLFRIGSNYKLFTATAVMQLAEQGLLDLDADINTYLDFDIPATFPEPITLKHLLTHTPGFEVSIRDYGAFEEEELQSLEEWIHTHTRERVRPPGEVTAYSNYGFNLASYIVERVSGQRFEQYVEENIFEPLGMNHSTVWQPLPPELSPDYHTGYYYVDGEYQSVRQLGLSENEFEHIHVPAASATVTDMARFMIAHLQNGSYTDEEIAEAQILEEATAQQMHSTLFTPNPRINGVAYGFWERNSNDQWILSHSGDTPTHHVTLAILPEQDLGIYVAWNGEGALALNEGPFLWDFLDHYFPVPAAAPAATGGDLARYTGSYRQTVGSYTTFEKLFAIFGALNLQEAGDGTLVINTPFGEHRYVEVEPLVLQQVDGRDVLTFYEDDQGEITYGFTNNMVVNSIEKLDWYESPSLHMGLMVAGVLLFLSAIIMAIVSWIRSRRAEEKEQSSRPARVARVLIVMISVLLLLFTAGLFLLIGQLGGYGLVFGVPTSLIILLSLPVLAALLTIGALLYTVLAWKDKYWGVAGRIHYTAVTLAAVAFIWSLNTLNLLGWQI